MRSRRTVDLARVNRAADGLVLPAAVWKTCPWDRRLVGTGLRQWLRCCGAAMRDDQVVGMPSHAIDEAWHGLILCTRVYAEFCDRAYGRFLHHHPEDGGGAIPDARQLERTVLAWHLVARPGEECVLWDADVRLGLPEPWGIPEPTVARVTAAAAAYRER